jgi:uncharacterized protein YecT (DUF1311 family)
MPLPKPCLAIVLASFSLMGACSQASSNTSETATSPLGTESSPPRKLQPAVVSPVTSPTATRVGNQASRTDTMVDQSNEHLLRQSFSECIDTSEGITPKMQICMETEYQFQDARLQTAYRALLQMESPEGQALIEKSQTEWISKNENDCSWDAQHEGQAQRLEANYCSMSSMAKRAADLERRLKAGK